MDRLENNATTNDTAEQYSYIQLLQDKVSERSAYYGHPLTYHVTTFGCQMNARDSEKLAGILEMAGYFPTESEDADFLIFNTCTVRENANMKMYGHLGIANRMKRNHPGMIIAVCGCMMQEADEVETVRKKYPFVDIVFGTHNIFRLAELIYRRFDLGKRVFDVWEGTEKIVEDLPTVRKYPFKTGINIMFGCNNFCSYCIVPYVRGRERSRNPQDILDEITKCAQDGVKEIMLLGQNVNSYGKTLKDPITFAQLLTQIEKIDGIERIRFMTSHPKDLSDELIEVMAASKKICRHLHLPIQSGSTKVLNDMNRRYTKEDYLLLVDKIRAAMPDISLTTDLIVGYPGETEEDFEETMNVVKSVRYDSAFTFIYSKRTGTPAAQREDQVDETIVHKRFDRLLKEVQRISSETCGRFEGQTKNVLVEDLNSQTDGYVTGKLEENITVHIPGTAEDIGKIIPVTLEKCHGFYYMGKRED